ncbi:MAG: S-layer homology domain-containing protein [Oscillospiraceae bacterium]|jgi:hypothetical protein|nr:S-layer homology domain-containing protein [Oscillospiraceae bacterium]
MKKSRRRIFAFCLAAAVLAGGVTAAAAPPEQPESDIQQIMSLLNVMHGYPNGDFGLGDRLTRAQFSKMCIALSPMRDQVASGSLISPFKDVPYTHWAASYIRAASLAGYMRGYPNGTFGPDRTLTVEEAVTVALRLLGYTASDLTGPYPQTQLSLAARLELTAAIDATRGHVITRGEAMTLLYTLLDTPQKQGGKLVATLGYQSVVLDEMLADKFEGPVTLGESPDASLRALGLNPAALSLQKDGSTAAVSALRPYDILYHVPGYQVARAYSTRVTGLYEKALPNRDAPAQVVVDGATYTLETDEAKALLSVTGSFRPGETVTLLMGREGVADVIPGGADDQHYIGIITAAETRSVTDAAGAVSQRRFVTVLLDTGETRELPAERDWSDSISLAVQVRYEDGTPRVQTLTRYNSGAPGLFDLAAGQLGTRTLSPEIIILERANKTGRLVLPQRLDGVRLTSMQVYYLGVDAQGRVNRLVLDAATGDHLSFGLLLSKTELPGTGVNVSAAYQYDIAGRRATATVKALFPVSYGPCHFSFAADGTLDDIQKLSAVDGTVSNLSRQYLDTAAGARHRVADDVTVYVYAQDKGGTYVLGTLTQALSHPLSKVEAYYDKPLAEAGCVRIIILR